MFEPHELVAMLMNAVIRERNKTDLAPTMMIRNLIGEAEQLSWETYNFI